MSNNSMRTVQNVSPSHCYKIILPYFLQPSRKREKMLSHKHFPSLSIFSTLPCCKLYMRQRTATELILCPRMCINAVRKGENDRYTAQVHSGHNKNEENDYTERRDRHIASCVCAIYWYTNSKIKYTTHFYHNIFHSAQNGKSRVDSKVLPNALSVISKSFQLGCCFTSVNNTFQFNVRFLWCQ